MQASKPRYVQCYSSESILWRCEPDSDGSNKAQREPRSGPGCVKIQFREQVLDASNNPIRALVTKRRIIPLLSRIRVEQLLVPDLVVCGVLLALAKDHPSV